MVALAPAGELSSRSGTAPTGSVGWARPIATMPDGPNHTISGKFCPWRSSLALAHPRVTAPTMHTTLSKTAERRTTRRGKGDRVARDLARFARGAELRRT